MCVEGRDVDGLDSNVDIYLEGGALYVSGPSGGMASAIDLDGSFLLTGGDLVTAGGIERFSDQSTQPLLYVSHGKNYPAGTVIELKDSKGNTLLRYAAQTAFSVSGFSSPGLTVGETYGIYIDGENVRNVTLSGMITNEGGTASGGGRP